MSPPGDGSGGRPPRWIRALGELLVRGPEREFILGDLEEMYRLRAAAGGRAAATAWLLLAVLRTASARVRTGFVAGLVGDARLALRQFRRVPRVHLGAAVVLAVGLGVATFAWGVYYAEHLRTLSVEGGDRVVELALLHREDGTRRPDVSIADLEAVRAGTSVFESTALVGTAAVQYNDDAAPPAQISALRVSPSFFELMEMRPALGRIFDASDARPGAPRVVVLGHGFWEDRYDRDPGVIGRSVRVYGQPTVVVGVLPEGARYLGSDPLWLPAGAHDDREYREWVALLKVRKGVSDIEVAASLRALSAGLRDRRPDAWAGIELLAVPFGSAMRGPHTSTKIRMLSWTGVLLYLMAVANVANLFLVRARARARELAVRRAIGADALRVLRQLAVEAALPAALGLVGGALVARGGLRWYRGAATLYGGGTPGPVWVHYGLEAPHVFLLVAGALVSTVFVSLVAGAWELRRHTAELLRGRGPSRGSFALGKGLLAVEVGAGGALLLFATLLLTGAWNLRTVDYGFTEESVLTGRVEPGPGYPDPESRLELYEALERELASAPGVEAVTLATQLPMIRRGGLHRIEVDAWEWDGRDPAGLPLHYADFVTPGFFRTFERPVMGGRSFDASDDDTTEPVALVNEPFARAFFPGSSPIGRRVRVWRGAEAGPWRSIVGVAPHLWMDTDVDARPEGIYVPMAQAPGPWAQVAIRVRGEPTAFAPLLREVVARLDPDLPVLEVQSMPDLIHGRTSLYRFQSPPFIAVGLAALFLSLAGLYAVVSYLASLRVVEFGIRAALGAGRWELVRRAATSALWPVAAGIAVGVAAGLVMVRGFDRWLFLVDPWAPGPIGLSVGVMALSALASALLPARRASRVDLVSVLKGD